MENEYQIIGEFRTFLKEMGWVVRWESEEAEKRGMFGEDATETAVPLIAGFMYAKTVDEIAKRKEEEANDGNEQGATREAGA